MSHRITIVCDSCEKEYMTSSDMDLPPYWMGLQIAVADKDGIVPTKDTFVHICSQDCLIEYAKSEAIKEKILLADKNEDPFPEEDAE